MSSSYLYFTTVNKNQFFCMYFRNMTIPRYFLELFSAHAEYAILMLSNMFWGTF